MGWGTALVGAGGTVAGSLIGGWFGQSADKKAYERQLAMMQSAHQYEVADLKAAGLNPILSGMGGSGASASSVSNTAGATAAAGASAGSRAASLVAGELDLMRAQAEAQRASAASSLATADETRRRADLELGKPGGVRVQNPETGEWLGGREPGLREREVIANVELLQQRAREAGYTNIRAAQEAQLYKDYPMVMPLEKLLDAYERLGGKPFSPAKNLPRKGGK